MDDDLRTVIGKNIKKYRSINNETATELSESIGVAQSTISAWENGKKMPRAGAIETLAEHWHINKSQLLTDEDQKKNTVKSNAELLAAHIDDDASSEDIQDIIDYIEFKKRQIDKRGE